MSDDHQNSDGDEEQQSVAVSRVIELYMQYLQNGWNRGNNVNRTERDSRRAIREERKLMHKKRKQYRDSDLATQLQRRCGYTGTNTLSYLRKRQLGGRPGFRPSLQQPRISNHFLPTTFTGNFASLDGAVYCTKISRDGSIAVVGSQDNVLAFYDCNALSTYGTDDADLYPFHATEALDVGWSILDTALSPNGRTAVYGGWSSSIYMLRIPPEVCPKSSEEYTAQYLGEVESATSDRRRERIREAYAEGLRPMSSNSGHMILEISSAEHRFAVFSLAYSTDGREILAASNDHRVYIYDLESNRRSLSFRGHSDDVNTCTYAECDNSNLIISGSDDCTVALWDRRLLDDSSHVRAKPVASFLGHTGGITSVSSKDDGRHFISCGKDQQIKLWDIRSPSAESDRGAASSWHGNWDYRVSSPPPASLSLDCDASILSLHGLRVTGTLIRCNFSPLETTGQRYVYSGSADGRIYLWDLKNLKIGEKYMYWDCSRSIIRDVSWHPTHNFVIAGSFSGEAVMSSYLDGYGDDGSWKFSGAIRDTNDVADDAAPSEDSMDVEVVLARAEGLFASSEEDSEGAGIDDNDNADDDDEGSDEEEEGNGIVYVGDEAMTYANAMVFAEDGVFINVDHPLEDVASDDSSEDD